MDDRPGCLTILGAYCMGTYLLVPLFVLVAGWHWIYVMAPLVFPPIYSLGVLQIGKSEIHIGNDVIVAGATWCALIVAAYGLIRSYERRAFIAWPVVLVVVAYAAAALWLWLL